MMPTKSWFTVVGAVVWNYLALHGGLNLFARADPLRTLAIYALLFVIAASAWGVYRLGRRARDRP